MAITWGSLYHPDVPYIITRLNIIGGETYRTSERARKNQYRKIPIFSASRPNTYMFYGWYISHYQPANRFPSRFHTDDSDSGIPIFVVGGADCFFAPNPAIIKTKTRGGHREVKSDPHMELSRRAPPVNSPSCQPPPQRTTPSY